MFNICDRKFSLKTVLLIADQLIETLHNKGFIHRDIRPQNLALGLNIKTHQIDITEYGQSKKYIDLQTNQHILYKENKSLAGNVRFASLSSHFGIENSRRDDLESLAYIFIYFLKGKIDWQGITCDTKQEKIQLVMEKKIMIQPEQIGKDLPHEFVLFLNYSRSLNFDEKPDYKFIQKLFKQLFLVNKFKRDLDYDWCDLIKEYQKPCLKIILNQPKYFNEQKPQCKDDSNILKKINKKSSTNQTGQFTQIENRTKDIVDSRIYLQQAIDNQYS